MIAHSSPTQALDPASFIVRARYELLGQLVERVLEGERYIVLSGAPGTGKSVMARAIHDQLLSRSVTVYRIERGESDSIGSRSIICQLLHKPEAAFQPDDVETLFDTLLARGDPSQRHAIIIDDAERLRPDALQYLRLMSNMLPEQMPPIVFVGRSSFWDVPGQPASSDAHDLITCRMELERLSDEEAHAFIREILPDAAAHPRLGDAAREALVRHADGSIGRLAALLTAVLAMTGARDMPSDRPTVVNHGDGQEPTPTIDKPAPLAALGSAMTILPRSDIVVNPVAISPPVEHARNSARWPTVVRHVTAAALTLTVVGAVAYWQLTVYAGQIQRAANSAQLTLAASSGAGDATQPAQEPPSASNAAIDDTAGTEPPAQASPPLADPTSSTSGPLHPSIQPALTAPVFQAFATDDADQPPAATAAERSVAPSDDPDVVWLDSVSGDQLLSLASVPTEPPSQPPAIGQSAAGTEPVEPRAAVVAEKPSEVVPAPNAAPIPPPVTDNALAAAPASPDPGANIRPSPVDAGRPERNAETAPIVASEPSNASTSTAEHMPAADAVAPTPPVPAIAKPVPDIAASPAVSAAPSDSLLVAAPSRPEQKTSGPLAPLAQVPPQQAATAPQPPVATPHTVPATSQQVSSAAAAPIAPPHTSAGSADIATPQAPAAPTALLGNPAASLRVPEPPKPPPVTASVASAPHLDLGLLLSRGNAMLALGDISAARLFYERAAALGSAGAATALGNTYDAAFLASIQAKGIVADQAAAIAWYRKAAALGDTDAVRQLKRLAPAQ